MKNNFIIKDKRWRSMAKAISWRITGTIDTILISWIITRKFYIALSIGAVELFTKMILFYFHERAWDHVKAGRVLVDYQI